MEDYSGLLSNVIEIIFGAWIIKYLFTMTKKLTEVGTQMKEVSRETMRLRDKQHDNANTLQDHELRIWKLESHNAKEKSNSTAER